MKHSSDTECKPFLVPPDPSGLLVQHCSECSVVHGDPCCYCGQRGFHALDCYEMRVQALEADGLTRSDAQSVVDAQDYIAEPPFGIELTEPTDGPMSPLR